MSDDFKIERWPEVFADFMAAKEARNAALASARKKLDAAQSAYADAVAAAPEVAAYEAARQRRLEFRQQATAAGFQLTDPRKQSVTPGVAVSPITKEG